MRLNWLLPLLAFLLFAGPACATPGDPYPDAWWQYVDPNTAPEWEILPQAANREKGEVILSKRTELGIFSNFAETPFEFDGKRPEPTPARSRSSSASARPPI